MTNENIDQLEQVRRSGEVNMMNRSGVQRVADEMNMNELVVTLEECDRHEYVELIEQL